MLNFVALQTRQVKISIVNYTNTLPFKWALKNAEILKKIDLQEDIPSICAQKLKFGQVDLALVPVALLPELPAYFIESDYCIGADGIVDSVKLYSQVPLEEIKTVVLDYQSRTSIALTRILFKNHWEKQVQFEDAQPGFETKIEGSKAAVVIGDRTFSLNGKFAFEFDLAQQWKQFTGLPFVFAAWVSTQKLENQFVKEFNSTLRNGLDHLEKAVELAPEDPHYTKAQVLEYLRERIDYNLNAKKKEALQLFLHYLKNL